MARMIPSRIDTYIKSSAERKIFEWFENDAETSDWIVLHSLGIAQHEKLIFGEVDFLVIAPKYGLFVLEVKGGKVGRDENGIWTFTDRSGRENKKERSPFEQAGEGMYSLIKYINKKTEKEGIPYKNLLFGYGVMFPDVDFELSDPSHDKEQVFCVSNGKKVGEFIKRLSKYFQSKWDDKYPDISSKTKLPDVSAAKNIAKLLRSDFDRPIALKAKIMEAEDETIRFTEEQYRFIDAIEDNPRCLLTGPAGTGKTLMALEDVKRSVMKGNKTAMFCYNVNLGDWLKEYFVANKEFSPDFVGTFHSFMCKVAGTNGPINSEVLTELPLRALEAIDDINMKYDKIIIDEMQDLTNRDFLDVIDASLNKGIERGCWTFFGDFRNQAIYSNINPDELIEMIADEAPAFVRLSLKDNCRNTRNIGKMVQKIAKMEDNEYKLLKNDGAPVDFKEFRNTADEAELLRNILNELVVEEKIDPTHITILSPVKYENSVASYLDAELRKSKISFNTIQSFKGLEKSVVIITDIDSYENDKLLYVGLSRAKNKLFVLESKNARKQRMILFYGEN